MQNVGRNRNYVKFVSCILPGFILLIRKERNRKVHLMNISELLHDAHFKIKCLILKVTSTNYS